MMTEEEIKKAENEIFPYMGTEENPHFMEDMIEHQRVGFREGLKYRQPEIDKLSNSFDELSRIFNDMLKGLIKGYEISIKELIK